MKLILANFYIISYFIQCNFFFLFSELSHIPEKNKSESHIPEKNKSELSVPNNLNFYQLLKATILQQNCRHRKACY